MWIGGVKRLTKLAKVSSAIAENNNPNVTDKMEDYSALQSKPSILNRGLFNILWMIWYSMNYVYCR